MDDQRAFCAAMHRLVTPHVDFNMDRNAENDRVLANNLARVMYSC
jgi:hypothetical protein